MIGNKIVCIVVVALVMALSALAGSSVLSVQVRKADIRETPSFLARIVGSAAYGDQVSVEQQSGPWMKVATSNGSGWLHTSALTTKRLTMTADGTTQRGASSGELALAGKGFNSAVEAEFKAGHRDIDFGPVDRMEQIRIPMATLQQFAQSGELHPPAGGAP